MVGRHLTVSTDLCIIDGVVIDRKIALGEQYKVDCDLFKGIFIHCDVSDLGGRFDISIGYKLF